MNWEKLFYLQSELDDHIKYIELDGKEPFNNYVIINLDEPYIDEIIEIMKRNGHCG